MATDNEIFEIKIKHLSIVPTNINGLGGYEEKEVETTFKFNKLNRKDSRCTDIVMMLFELYEDKINDLGEKETVLNKDTVKRMVFSALNKLLIKENDILYKKDELIADSFAFVKFSMEYLSKEVTPFLNSFLETFNTPVQTTNLQ